MRYKCRQAPRSENTAVENRKPWNPFPALLSGIVLGAIIGAVMIWRKRAAEFWQDQTDLESQMALVTAAIFGVVAYVRHIITRISS